MYLHKRPHWFWIDSIEWPIFFIIIVRLFSSSIPCIFKFMTHYIWYFLVCCDFKSDRMICLLASKWEILYENIPEFGQNIHFSNNNNNNLNSSSRKKQHISIPFLMLKTCPSKLPTKNRFVIFYFGLKIHSFWHFSKHMYYYRYNNIYSTPGLNGDERWCLNQKFRITNIDKSLWLPSVSPWTFKLCFLVENAKYQVPVKSVSVSRA